MKPLVPLTNRAYLKPYVQAGAEEFYAGFYDDAWQARFGQAADLNRMSGFRQQANPYCFEEVFDLVGEVRGLGKKLYVTFNANVYTQPQLDFLYGYFERLHAAGATGVIVSVPEAVEPAYDSGLEVVASTMCGVCNADIARFYCQLGCSRVIVPRDMSLAEIEAMVREAPDLTWEVFLMRNGCIFSDAYCLGRHFQNGNALCWDIRHTKRVFYAKENNPDLLQALQQNNEDYGAFHQTACGLCAIYRLEQAGVASAKIVGRSDNAAHVLQDIEAVSRNVEIARNSTTEQEYLEQMYVPPERVDNCANALSCYYPEVRFPCEQEINGEQATERGQAVFA